MQELVVLIIFLALLFDFLNGMNDAANSIATIVSTRVLSPRLAVAWAAFFNLIAAFIFGVEVATTIGKGIVEHTVVTQKMILAGLLSSIGWVYVCTRFGIPISVSHALVGGQVGAALAMAGSESLIASGLIKVGVAIFLSPIIGLVLGGTFMVVVHWVFRRWSGSRVDRFFRVGQLISSAAFSLGHGTNDAQKTMGIIAVTLYSAGYLGGEFYVPFWVVISAHVAIAAGTLIGGWRVVRTMGVRLTKLQPSGGFCAETAGAILLFVTAKLGIPASTTHTIAGAIMGVGATRRLSAVRWGVAGRIVWAWVLTIPIAAIVAWLLYFVVDALI